MSLIFLNLLNGVLNSKLKYVKIVVVADKITNQKDFSTRVDSLSLKTYLRCIAQARKIQQEFLGISEDLRTRKIILKKE